MKRRGQQCCLECDGRGRELSCEPDEPTCFVRCEACDGSGELADCACCDEPTALPELEDRGGHCFKCAAALELGDQAAEYLRVGVNR